MEKHKHKKNKQWLLLLSLHTVPFSAERQAGKSCEYQCLSQWFDPTQNQTQSLLLQ